MSRLKKSAPGFIFIEVLIVVCFLMVFMLALLIGLQTSAQVVNKSEGLAAAEALAKSEVEFVKVQTYEQNMTWVYTLPSGSRPWSGGPIVPAGYTLSVSAGAVSGFIVTVTDGGSGITSAPTVSFSGGGGTGASGTVVITKGVHTITITNAGSGYTAAPLISMTGGGGSGATATATIASGHVSSITINYQGSGYTSAPTLSFSGGGGAGAAATASLTGYVSAITIDSEGSGYTSNPTVSFSGGGGTGAMAVAQIALPSDIQQIIVTVTRSSADKPWMYAHYTLTDYWRTP